MQEDSVANEMLSLGYVRVDRGVFKASWSSTTVEHFVFLSSDSRQYMGAQFGLRNPPAEDFGCASLCKYGHPNFGRLRQHRKSETTCNMTFDFGRIDKYARTVWPIIHLRTVEKSYLARVIVDTLKNYIFPHVRHALNLRTFLDVLVGTNEPFPWFAVNRAIRAAQVVAVARQLGIKQNTIRSMVAPYDRQIVADLHRREAQPKLCVDEYVTQLVSDWDRRLAPQEH